MKKCIVSVLAMFAIVLFATVPAQASSFDDGLVGVSQSQPLPAFMHGLDAAPMTDSEMSEVRGEWVLSFALWFAENAVMMYELGMAYWSAFQIVSQAPSGTAVYLGTANSTPAYYIKP